MILSILPSVTKSNPTKKIDALSDSPGANVFPARHHWQPVPPTPFRDRSGPEKLKAMFPPLPSLGEICRKAETLLKILTLSARESCAENITRMNSAKARFTFDSFGVGLSLKCNFARHANSSRPFCGYRQMLLLRTELALGTWPGSS